jgi:uncharacterized protein (TIGR03083 family)
MYKTQGRSAAQLDPWRIYAAERADVHDFLASLTPAQWDAPSLCQGWRIRDVAVHLLVDEPVEQLGLPLALVKAAWFRFSVHRINDWWVRRNQDRPADSIVTAFAGAWQPGRISKLVGPRTSVRAMVIHHQDMRRPLGMRRAVPEERLRAALDVILTPQGSHNLGSFERGSGLRLQATDIDWSWGDGPTILGPAESILMAVAGRRGVIAELSGPGLPILASRIQTPTPDEA